nr:hypothetical protein F383_08963 [Ipomoea batatas]
MKERLMKLISKEPLPLPNWPMPIMIYELEAAKLYLFQDQGLTTTANPILALFSTALVSTSPVMVKTDLEQHWCWMRAVAMPRLLTLAFTVVNGSSECCVPMVRVFSSLEKLRVNSVPAAVFVIGLTEW